MTGMKSAGSTSAFPTKGGGRDTRLRALVREGGAGALAAPIIHAAFALLAVVLFATGMIPSSGLIGNAAVPSTAEKAYMVDFLPLQAGVNVDQAEDYFALIGQVMQTHGLKRIASYRVGQVMAGSNEPQLINFYEVGSEATISALMGDPAYEQHVRVRNRTFDMPRVGMLMLRPITPVSLEAQAGHLYFVDLLPLQPGADVERQEEYFERVGSVINKHGLNRLGGFEVTAVMGTPDISPDLVNLWSVDTPETFPGIMGDPQYQRHVEFRNGTFVMKDASMFMLAGASGP